MALIEFLLDHFLGFPRLPPELRIKIWRTALPPPRLVTIEIDSQSSAPTLQVQAQQVGLLWVCHESRVEALKAYSRVICNNNRGTCIYINWAVDTVFLEEQCVTVGMDLTIGLIGPKFRYIQSIAIKMQEWLLWDFQDFLREFGQLQKLIFVGKPYAGQYCKWCIRDWGWNGLSVVAMYDPAGQIESHSRGFIRQSKSEHFDECQWEMTFEQLGLVKSLIVRGESFYIFFQ
jgi:hypothetical protein